MVTIYEDKDSSYQPDQDINTPPARQIEPVKSKINGPTDGLSAFINTFLSEYEQNLREKHAPVEATIKVSELLGKLARLYERVRNTVEYKGEHVLRRNAIERILRRLVWEQQTALAPKPLLVSGIDVNHIAETLLKELVRARYLPNSTIPTSKIGEVERVIEKYLYLLKQLKNLPSSIPVAKSTDWIWGVASSEIEDLVDPSNRELYVRLMYDWFVSYFDWGEADIPESERLLQIYLAIHRAYPKSDDPIMRFHLLLRKHPSWRKAEEKDVNKFTERFPEIYKEIESDLNFKGKYSLYRKIQRYAAAFEIFHAIAEDEKSGLQSLLLNEGRLEDKIRNVCEKKYKLIRARVNTGIVRSIVYIFITKVVFALLIEVPYEIFRFGDVRYLPLTLNIMIPPIAMWAIGFSIKIPAEKNTHQIIARLKSVVYESESGAKHAFSIAQGKAKSTLAQIFTVVYAALFVLVFGTIAYLLLKIHFTLLGIIIFFGFMSLVLLFAFRVRFSAEQLKVEAEEEGFFGHLFSYLTLPFLNFGFYLSKGLAKLNFFTILLDFLIEAPLKSIIEVFEEWTSFLRQKKEEVVEMPE